MANIRGGAHLNEIQHLILATLLFGKISNGGRPVVHRTSAGLARAAKTPETNAEWRRKRLPRKTDEKPAATPRRFCRVPGAPGSSAQNRGKQLRIPRNFAVRTASRGNAGGNTGNQCGMASQTPSAKNRRKTRCNPTCFCRVPGAPGSNAQNRGKQLRIPRDSAARTASRENAGENTGNQCGMLPELDAGFRSDGPRP